MRRVICFLAACALAACGSGGGLVAEVTNETDLERSSETVEIAWGDLRRAGVTADNVVVTTAEGEQIPSQVIFDRAGEPVTLLFQATVAPASSTSYRIEAGEREAYEPQAYGRYVPERADDYAWENNLVAYRIYGPALADPRTQGIDVWVKSTPRLVINEWYGRNDYHHNYGEGMDCYKVASTLGGGAMAPVADGHIVLTGNYATQRCMANGPVRTMAEFTYAPVRVGDRDVTMTRRIWLDANTRFSVQEYLFDGFDGEMDVAAGIVLHDVRSKASGDGYAAVTEAASDSADPVRDGDIMLGVVVEGGGAVSEADGHILVSGRVEAGERIRMRSGSAWSQGGVSSAQEWERMVREESIRAASPLKVTLHR